MKSDKIEIGDVVKLRSGGPAMSVVDIVPVYDPERQRMMQDSVRTVYFNRQGELKSSTFQPGELRKVNIFELALYHLGF
jgi:uncharacterized protein YodC (DUF2158 family)